MKYAELLVPMHADGHTIEAGEVCMVLKDYGDTLDLAHGPTNTAFWAFNVEVNILGEDGTPAVEKPSILADLSHAMVEGTFVLLALAAGMAALWAFAPSIVAAARSLTG